jgi:dTDP-glucose 4,6-dehydratase
VTAGGRKPKAVSRKPRGASSLVALVAGGAGFIGSHLCDHLLERGFDVLCLDNLVTGSKRNIRHLFNRPGFRFQHADVTAPDFLRSSLIVHRSRVDVVFNLASPASPRDYLSLPLETLAVGSQGTRNLLELALRKKAVFVQASTSEVYGDPLLHPQSESYWGNVNPVGPRSVYDEAKRFGEALVMAYHRRHGLATRIARIFNTYGPRMQHDDGRIVPTLVHQALTCKPLTVFGTGRQTRSFCYVSDMVEGLYRLASCTDPMPVNLGNPQEFTVLRFARMVRKMTGSRNPLRFEPLPEDDPKRRRPNITRASRLLHWRPQVELEQGLKLTIDWFRTQRLRA